MNFKIPRLFLVTMFFFTSFLHVILFEFIVSKSNLKKNKSIQWFDLNELKIYKNNIIPDFEFEKKNLDQNNSTKKI